MVKKPLPQSIHLIFTPGQNNPDHGCENTLGDKAATWLPTLAAKSKTRLPALPLVEGLTDSR